jgi:hypothetical protein
VFSVHECVCGVGKRVCVCVFFVSACVECMCCVCRVCV